MKWWSNSEIPSVSTQVPEKRLLAAVLQRAIADFVGGEGDVRDGAEAWIMNDELADAPLSFRFVCEALDLEKSSLRKAIGFQAKYAQAPVLKEVAS